MKGRSLLRCCMLLFACLLVAAQVRAQDAQEITVFRTYYKSGHIREISRQGRFMGCGVPVGTDSIFSGRGKLQKVISYDHQPGAGRGCHDIVTRQTITTFYANGKRRSVAYMKACYECEPVATGRWQWYDSQGKLVRSKKQTE